MAWSDRIEDYSKRDKSGVLSICEEDNEPKRGQHEPPSHSHVPLDTGRKTMVIHRSVTTGQKIYRKICISVARGHEVKYGND
jgi:hypothetical protein